MKLTPKRFPFLEDYRLPHGYELLKRKRKLAGDENDFHIVALGDNVTLADGGVFTAILGFGLEALSSLFGANRKKLNQSDWLQIMPVSGVWNNALRNYLSIHIAYDTDLGNIPSYTEHFVHQNLSQISGGKYGNLSTQPSSTEWASYMQKFYAMLNAERQQAGYEGGLIDITKKSNTGFNAADLFGGSDLSMILLVGAGLGLVFALINKKK